MLLICTGTETNEVMAWHNRMKVAIGAARGLRYLHEDCRVGCIVHRDFRPNNILLTHDFEPMVSPFTSLKKLPSSRTSIFHEDNTSCFCIKDFKLFDPNSM